MVRTAQALLNPFIFSSRLASESQRGIQLEQCFNPDSQASLACFKLPNRSSSCPSINHNLKNDGKSFSPSSSNLLSLFLSVCREGRTTPQHTSLLSLSAQVFTTSCGVFIVCIGTRIPMAKEAPPSQTQSGSDPDPLQYWCYHCDKRVSIETLPDVVCHECKNGFVESIAAANPSPPPSRTSDLVNEPYFGSRFLLMAPASRTRENI